MVSIGTGAVESLRGSRGCSMLTGQSKCYTMPNVRESGSIQRVESLSFSSLHLAEHRNQLKWASESEGLLQYSALYEVIQIRDIYIVAGLRRDCRLQYRPELPISSTWTFNV